MGTAYWKYDPEAAYLKRIGNTSFQIKLMEKVDMHRESTMFSMISDSRTRKTQCKMSIRVSSNHESVAKVGPHTPYHVLCFTRVIS